MKKKSQFAWSAAQVSAHCLKTGQKNPLDTHTSSPNQKTPRRGRMNKTESAYARILEAMKVRGDIEGFVFEGIRLAWGEDPETGKQMHYAPDFVITEVGKPMRLIEVKGGHIFSRDLVRFKGCRACWPQFKFEMWQKKAGEWKRIQ